MFSTSFLIAAAERAVKAAAATLLAFLPANGLDAVPDLNWGDMLALSGYAALASLLFSVVSSQLGDNPGPSLANETIATGEADDDGYGAIELLVAVILVLLVIYVAANLF
jgi:hypothetical protein